MHRRNNHSWLSCTALMAFALTISMPLAGQSQDGREYFVTNQPPLAKTGEVKLDKTKAIRVMEDFDAEAEIRGLYEKFSSYAVASGYDIRFELSDFETFLPHQFDEVYWNKLFTFPGGWIVDTIPMEFRNFDPGVNYIHWESKWVEQGDVSQELVQAIGAAKIPVALDGLRRWDPKQFDGVVAVTTFESRVELNDRSRNYRAAFLWAPVSKRTILFSLIDHVVSGVGETVHESLPALSKDRLMARRAGKERPWFSNKSGSCIDGPSQDQFAPPQSSPAWADRHSSGSHYASFKLGVTCDTAENCNSTCMPYAASAICSETGSITAIGKVHAKYRKFTSVAEVGSNGEESTCSGAFGCAVKECVWGTCGGMTWTIGYAGSGVTIGAASGVLDDMSLSTSWKCPGAEEIAGDIDQEEENECVESPCEPTAVSPVVISTLDGHYIMVGLRDGVFFDLDADGEAEQTAWTEPYSDEAFLVLDRNQNGTIDDGTELFGNFTAQPPSDDPNGFLALAEWDRASNGGNEDGRIDADDSVFDALRLWIDSSQNGVSEAAEMLPLTHYGILYIDLDYREAGRKDKFGNEFRFKTKVGREQGVVMAWDVFFVTE